MYTCSKGRSGKNCSSRESLRWCTCGISSTCATYLSRGTMMAKGAMAVVNKQDG